MKRAYNFDEWRPWEQNASPFLLVLTLNSGMSDLRRYFGTALWTSVIIFEDNQAKWLFRPKELKLLGQKMIDFLMCPPYRVAFLTGFDKAEKSLLEMARKIQFSTNLEDFTNKEIITLFDNYSQIYCDWYKYGWFCEPVQFQTQDILLSFIKKEIENDKSSIQNIDPDKAVQALFSIDEEPFFVTIIRDLKECAEALEMVLREDDLSNEINGIREKDNFPELAANIISTNAKDRTGEVFSTLINKLKEHSRKYYWKRNNYFSTEFLNEENILEDLFRDDDFQVSDPAETFRNQLFQIEESKKLVSEQKAKLLELLPSYQKNISALASSIGGFLLDTRKKDIMIANAAFDHILLEVSKRTKVSVHECHLLIPQELEDFLKNPEEYRERFIGRKNKFVVYQGDFPLLDELFHDVASKSEKGELNYKNFSMDDPYIAEGAQADKAIEQLNSRLNYFADYDSSSFQIIEGVSIYYNSDKPMLTGIVKVIRDPKNEKLKKDQILVATSTTPDFIDAIQRSKAIITDWGGQTSHAAIVSRELRKPCIIGTNYASQVLHDGDKIRIDFSQGRVEVIQRAGDL